MSSGFVSAGTSQDPPAHDAEWDRVEKEVEAQRSRKAQQANPNDGKSLYEVLQANKAAKQEAFEEAAKLKNQFRALDDDEVDFLDAVLESTRQKESAVHKETAEQLELFRKQREQADKTGLTDKDVEADDEQLQLQQQWSNRKRKKGPERAAGLKGVKVRKPSASSEPRHEAQQDRLSPATPSDADAERLAAPLTSGAAVAKEATTSASAVNATKPAKGHLGLTAYSDSDEDD